MTARRSDHHRWDRPELAPLWDELARRYGEGEDPVTILMPRLSPSQRNAIADLLGLDRLPPARSRVRVDRIAAAVGVRDAASMRSLVEQLRGPIENRRAARAAVRRARDELWGWLAAQASAIPILRAHEGAAEAWVDGMRASGIPGGDPEAHRRRLADVLAIIAKLPTDSIALASLADDVMCDPHALDRGGSAQGLVLDALAAALGRPRATDAESARALWEEVGVVPDPLSSTVLALGLCPPGDDPLSLWLREATAAGEPASLTLAQLRRWPIAPLPAHGVGYVVENPSLIAEAAAHSWSGPPLVCSSGRPTLAVVTLLRQLAAEGAIVRQHADFDAVGLEIVAWLSQRAATTPWRMDAHDYTAAIATDRRRRPLTGRLPTTPWDPQLRVVMADAGVAVYEEEVRSALLAAMCAQ